VELLFQRTGPPVGLARGEDESGIVWREAKTSIGGAQPSQPIKGSEKLTPQELLDALRGPLGAGQALRGATLRRWPLVSPRW
jgi:hypothetical protein